MILLDSVLITTSLSPPSAGPPPRLLLPQILRRDILTLRLYTPTRHPNLPSTLHSLLPVLYRRTPQTHSPTTCIDSFFAKIPRPARSNLQYMACIHSFFPKTSRPARSNRYHR
ncbi:hypothetical protein B0H13DRAFT_2672726 [Mycena leptocephala]|nr:hypothetical protein B0H13DRAFT_2672726 [Mycena leptocephala]